MPATQLSVSLTRAYRGHIDARRTGAQALTRLLWGRIPRDRPDLDAEYARLVLTLIPAVAAAQLQAARASVGYLKAFLTSELGEPAEVKPPDFQVGTDRGGRPLSEAFASPLIGVKASLKQGRSLGRALRDGLVRAERIAWLSVDHAARQCLQDAMHADERVTGYQRAVRGTCGACLGAASGTFGTGVAFKAHPYCQCVASPQVSGVRDRFPVPTGAVIFAAMSKAQQDEAVGSDAAEMVRTDKITLSALVTVATQRQGQDFITQAPTHPILT